MLTAITPAGQVITRDEDHVYRVDGAITISVTQVLRAQNLPDYSGIPPAVLERKRQLGQYVHHCVEAFNQGRLDESQLWPEARPYFEAFLSWLDRKGFVITQSETLVYSARFQYCGQIDLIPLDDIWDLKCRENIGAEVGLQLAAYRRAYCEMHGLPMDKLGCWALQLKKDGTYKEHRFDDPAHDPGFINMLGALNWRRRFCHGQVA